jgi:hypothetical protein
MNRPFWLVECDVSDPDLTEALTYVLDRIPRLPRPEDFPYVEIYEVQQTIEGANVHESDAGLFQIRLAPKKLKASTKGRREALIGLVAHEIAHALLRHQAEGDDLAEEEEADARARTWVGADVDIFRQIVGPPTPQCAASA